jgi:hypothetical protein
VFGGRGDVVELNGQSGESEPGVRNTCQWLVERSASVVRQPIRAELPARSAGGSPDGLKMNYALMRFYN